MELLSVLGVLLLLGLLGGAVLGWVALFRTLRLEREIGELRIELTRFMALAAQRAPRPPEALPTPQTQPKERPSTPPRAAAAVDHPLEQPLLPPPEPGPPAEPPSSPPPPPAAPDNIFRSIEASLSGNWLVWVAGAALALGGLFLVKHALDHGWLGPWARVIAAVAAGLAMIAASEVLRGGPLALRLSAKLPSGLFVSGPLAHSAAPAVTAGAGLITIYGAIYAAFGLYALIPGPLAFALLALTAAGAVALALVHGPKLAALGLGGAFAAPALIGSDDPSAPALFAYVFAVAGAGLAVTRLVGRRWPALVALGGGAIWPLIWLAFGYRDDQAWALAVYLPALLAAAIAFAWDQAEHPPRLETTSALWSDAPVSLAAAYLATLAVVGLQYLLAEATWHAPAAILSVWATSALTLAAAWRREGLFGAPVIAVAGAALLLYTWPAARAVLIDAEISVARAVGGPSAGPAGPAYLTTCLGFAALFGVGGLFAQDRLRLKGAMAAVTAGAPPLILAIAFWRLTGLEQDWRWAGAATLLAAIYLFLLERQAKAEGGPDGAPGPVSAYALGACASAGMAVGMALDQLWMSVGFAILVPVAALLRRRFGAVVLQWAAIAFGLIATLRLTFMPEVSHFEVGEVPLLNMLVWGYGVPIAALWAARRIFLHDGLPRDGRTVQAVEAQAIVLAVAFVSLEIRHLMNGGDLDAPYLDDLAEVGLQSSAWLAGALLLRWRLDPRLYFAQRWAERLLIAAALAQTTILQLLWINPWWGPEPMPVPGPVIANGLLLAYALPAALAAAYALVARGQGMIRVGAAAGLVGSALALAWVTLETRHVFNPERLSAPELTGDLERHAYSAVWLGFASGLLALGAVRRRPSLRYAAFGLLVIVTLKVFIDSWSSLEGVLKGLSLIGLGAALMAIAVLYQRLGTAPAGQRASADNAA